MGLFELLQKIVGVFESIQIPYLITGAVAAMAYGEPRLINDLSLLPKMEATKLFSSFVVPGTGHGG